MAATVRSVLTAGVLPANAAAWAEGVLSIMSTVSWRAGAALVLTLSILAAGAFGYRQWASGEPQEEQAKAVDAKPAAEGRQPKTDRYGDPLPAGALARLGTVRFLHGGVVRSVAFSKDQKTVASAGDDKMVRLWDLTTGKEIRRFVGHDKWVYTVAFSPDGKILASAGDDQTIRLWEIATGKEIRKLLGHEKEVNSIAFSPDGKVLASGSSDKTIRLWDVGTGKQERQCEGKIGWVGSVVFFPDGKTLVSGSYEDGIHLWDVSSGKELSKPWLPRTGVLGTALSADGKILATNGKDDLGTSLWEIATGTMLRKLQTDRRESEHAVFSPDGTTLATGGMNGPVRTWEVASGKELSRSEGFERGATAMASSPDGKILVTGSLDQRVRLWQTSTGKQIYPFEGHTVSVRSVDYGSDSKTLISAGYDGTVRVWDVANAKEMRRFSPYRSNLHVPLAISPNRQTLVSTDLDQKIRFWDLASGKEQQGFDRYSGSSIAFFFPPDGTVLAADLKDQVIRLYDVRTGKEIRVLAGKQEHPHPVAFSPDGKWLAAVCFSKADREMTSKLKVWSVETGAELPQFQGQRVPLGSTLAFSPDSKMVAGETDEGIYLWEIATGKKRIKLEQGRAYSLAFSADGRTIASGHWDGMVCLWEVASGKRICCFDGHLARVFSVAFSPDGRTLSSGSEDATVLIWDLAGRLKQSKAGRVKLLPRELESLWNDLADRDAAGAYQSVWSLVDAAHESVPFLDTRLRRVLSKDADRQKRVAQMIAALDSDEFAEREKAIAELEALGDLAEPALRRALEGKASLEVSRRVERLLETLAGPVTSPETLQVVRAVEVLERIGTPDARQLLETLAKVASQGRLVQEAKAALERLNRRSAEK
jgi:WD40 repeat protein